VFFMARHRFGRQWRACAQDLRMAALCGIDTRTTLAVTLVIAAGYAAAGGAVIALYYGNVNFYMGTVLGLKALLVAVIGGLGSVPGALVGGLVLGFLESLWSAYFAANYRDVVVFGALIAMLIFRPQGLFATAARRDHDRA
jgi:branched-chain amino acid transport system permease protein